MSIALFKAVINWIAFIILTVSVIISPLDVYLKLLCVSGILFLIAFSVVDLEDSE